MSISANTVRELLKYYPDSGKFIWKERRPQWFLSTRDCKGWNTKFAGKPAFIHVDANGYVVGRILGKRQKAHRIAWLYVFGEMPSMVDHINGDTEDNRIANLRIITPSENQKNCKRRTDNSSGCTGVVWYKSIGKWGATYFSKGKRHHLGVFENFDDAVTARKAAEQKHEYHKNHGRVRIVAVPAIGKEAA